MRFSSEHMEYIKMNDSHWEVYFNLVSQDHVMQWVHGQGLTLSEAQAKFEKSLKENDAHPILGNYALFYEDKYAGIGKMYGPDPTEVEIGYILASDLWGRGIGSEVCTRLIKETLSVQGVKKLVATIDPNNGASRRILNKNGFTTCAQGEERGLPAEYLERVIYSKP